MNIIVRTFGGKTVARPDTTWDRKSEDFVPPESVQSLSCVPILTGRVSKTGKCVSGRFAGRYFDVIGFGALLYPENFIDGSPEGFAMASCLDHSTYIPTPFFQKVTLGQEDNWFKLCCGDKVLFEGNMFTEKQLEKAVSEVTQTTYIRIGDIVALELSEHIPLVKREDGIVQVSATWCERQIMDFKVIF